jgi:arabinoxylan arabinofuranohydrolase
VRLTSLCVFVAVCLEGTAAQADYPIVSHRYLADPGSVVYGDRVYLYNSNDDDNAEAGGYTMHSIVCVSSADMKNWTDHGIVFQVPQDASWATNSWAPQPITRDGTIFLYFGNSASGIGVASSETPTGHFSDARDSVLVNASTPGAPGTDSWLFDPGALIDEDGKAYLSFGGNGETNARVIELGADLTSVVGDASPLAPKAFFEASFLFKRNDIYYLAYSTNPDNEMRIDYLTSDNPMSGYTYGGVIGAQPPSNGNNNHASEFEFQGQWYHAYHNRVVATGAGIEKTYKRNLAIEVLNFNEDGSIVEVEYTTDGVPQVGHIDPYQLVEAETTHTQSGIETEPCAEGGMNVTSVDSGDWLQVYGVDFGSEGASQFSARVASMSDGGNIELRLDSATGTLVGTCPVPATGGEQEWVEASCDVEGASGVHNLFLVFATGGFNVNSWQFTPVGGTTPAPGTAGSGGAAGDAGGSTASGGAASLGGAANGGTGGVSAPIGSTTAGGAASGPMPNSGSTTTPTSPSQTTTQSQPGGTAPLASTPTAPSGAPLLSASATATTSNTAVATNSDASSTAPAQDVGSGGSPTVNSDSDKSNGGCACRAASRSPTTSSALLGALFVALLYVRRTKNHGLS